jgi:hypothetical protein
VGSISNSPHTTTTSLPIVDSRVGKKLRCRSLICLKGGVSVYLGYFCSYYATPSPGRGLPNLLFCSYDRHHHHGRHPHRQRRPGEEFYRPTKATFIAVESICLIRIFQAAAAAASVVATTTGSDIVLIYSFQNTRQHLMMLPLRNPILLNLSSWLSHPRRLT